MQKARDFVHFYTQEGFCPESVIRQLCHLPMHSSLEGHNIMSCILKVKLSPFALSIGEKHSVWCISLSV